MKTFNAISVKTLVTNSFCLDAKTIGAGIFSRAAALGKGKEMLGLANPPMARVTWFKGLLIGAGIVACLLIWEALGRQAGATEYAATAHQVKEANCATRLYIGLEEGSLDYCDKIFFLPASAAIKCSLYREAGYPSRLMRNACRLYDQGFGQYYLDDAEARN